jgi:hypothetical protein
MAAAAVAPCEAPPDRQLYDVRASWEIAVGDPQQRRVELKLAEAGGDLRPAIEAAQFARLVEQPDRADDSEAAAAAALVETFATAAEAWDDLTGTARSALLARLGGHLDELERVGLFVHWGRVTLMLAEADGGRQLPLAILSIGRAGQPTIEVTIPGAVALDAGPGPGTLH